MIKKPTQQTVEAEIAWLEKNRKLIPTITAFGDNNNDAIDAVLEVLREGLSEEECYDKEENGVWTERTCQCAREAALWLEGDGQPPSSPDQWGNLVRK